MLHNLFNPQISTNFLSQSSEEISSSILTSKIQFTLYKKYSHLPSFKKPVDNKNRKTLPQKKGVRKGKIVNWNVMEWTKKVGIRSNSTTFSPLRVAKRNVSIGETME